MTNPYADPPPTVVAVEELAAFHGSDLADLCDATVYAIREGGGFGWVRPPERPVLERYWAGVLAVPGRSLLVGRLDGVITASAQLVRPPPNNEAQAFAAAVMTQFVIPWARGHGLARGLMTLAERLARDDGFDVLTFDCRETQRAAAQLCRSLGYRHWGTNPVYARVDGRVVAGLYFYKALTPDPIDPAADAGESRTP